MKLSIPEEDYKKVWTEDRIVGFVSIEELGAAQQVKVTIDELKRVLEIVLNLKQAHFTDVVLTVEKGQPIIIGDFKGGIGLAALAMSEEKEEEKTDE